MLRNSTESTLSEILLSTNISTRYFQSPVFGWLAPILRVNVIHPALGS